MIYKRETLIFLFFHPASLYYAVTSHTERKLRASYLERSGKCFIAECNGAASSSGVL